jgi:predicted DNA-binding WGR domain protein
MKEYLEFKDGSSHKFWQIEVTGKAYKVTYGRIGSDGQVTEKEFGSEEEALKEANSVMNSKIKKGYQKVEQKSEALKTKKFALNRDEDEETMDVLKKSMTDFFNSKKASEINEIVLGEWEEPFECDPKELIDLIIENKNKIPNVKHFFIGDMDSESCEISWINLCDMTPLLTEFPNLESLRIDGSTGLEFKTIKHEKLKKLEIVCGGLGKDVIEAIATAELPSLEHLELYLGTDDYGFDGSINDILPLMDKGRFPKLKYLGLVDSIIADQIAEEIVKSDIFDQLDVLDLSQGTLSDKGAEFLLGCDKINKLKSLDLHYHFMSDETMKKFKKFKIPVNVSEKQDDEDGEYRFVSVGE